MKKASKKKSTAKKTKKAKKVTGKKAKKTAKSTAKKTKKAKKAKKSTRTKPASAAGAQGSVSGGMVDKQPEVKEQAAVAHAMFLYVDDAWAQAYFNQNDLHFLEREVFG